MSYSAIDVARYFLKIDESNSIFTDELINKNNHNFYKGNALLNKYLFFAQTLYFVKNKKIIIF
ncbi:MAG: hypothetical protein PHX04_03365 [Bacilli bacterium]|nr:hypothetical protein [Bacilli bacterium]